MVSPREYYFLKIITIAKFIKSLIMVSSTQQKVSLYLLAHVISAILHICGIPYILWDVLLFSDEQTKAWRRYIRPRIYCRGDLITDFSPKIMLYMYIVFRVYKHMLFPLDLPPHRLVTVCSKCILLAICFCTFHQSNWKALSIEHLSTYLKQGT